MKQGPNVHQCESFNLFNQAYESSTEEKVHNMDEQSEEYQNKHNGSSKFEKLKFECINHAGERLCDAQR